MRWTLLSTAVAHGDAGPAEIDSYLQQDSTASGERRAMGLRAQVREGKAEMWQQLMHDDGLANALQDAGTMSFNHPDQRELLEPFTDSYFDQIAEVWGRRSSEVAQKVAIGLFPRWAIRPEVVERALAFEAAGHPPALRRLVSEGRAAVQRALAARAKDQQP